MVESMILKAKRRGRWFGVEVKRGGNQRKWCITNYSKSKQIMHTSNSYINLGKAAGGSGSLVVA
jgi:hypothetical protein